MIPHEDQPGGLSDRSPSQRGYFKGNDKSQEGKDPIIRGRRKQWQKF
jgi:hypothetical protein